MIQIHPNDQCHYFCLPAIVCTELPHQQLNYQLWVLNSVQAKDWKKFIPRGGLSGPLLAEREKSNSTAAHRVV